LTSTDIASGLIVNITKIAPTKILIRAIGPIEKAATMSLPPIAPKSAKPDITTRRPKMKQLFLEHH